MQRNGEANSLDDRNAGHVVMEIGIAPLKPAEFVTFRISQSLGLGTEVRRAAIDLPNLELDGLSVPADSSRNVIDTDDQ